MTRACPACDAANPRDAGAKNGHHLVRCRRCATLFTAAAVHGDYSDYYAHGNPTIPAFVEARADEIVSGFANARRSGRLLDVGFGGGTFLDAARRGGWAAEGVETSPDAVASARARGFEVHHGTLADARYPAGHFDVVIASEVLEHVLEVRAMLEEIARVLRPGGMLWATTPHGRGISARLLRNAWSVISPPEHVQLFSIRGLRTLLRESGFRDVAIAAESVNPREIADRIRGRRVGGHERVESGYALGEFLSARPSRRAFKRAANRTLALLRLGDSLKITART